MMMITISLVVSVLGTAVPVVSAQSRGAAPGPARLPDGQPNMQGIYTRNGIGGLEAEPPVNPIDPSARNPLSVSNRGDGLGPYPGVFGQGGQALRGPAGQCGAAQKRATGIVDPPDRKLP